MKHLHHNGWSFKKTASLFLSLIFLFLAVSGSAQIYRANLSGPNEAPPNASPGTGTAVVTIMGNDMRVQANFTGLIGLTTASHIHAATAVAGVGTIGVATAVPSFPGFPLGVSSGTFDVTYDMTMTSSYNPGYINNNGGTVATAFAALKAALDAGKAYFNVHSSAFGGGEIRGFLMLCPSISVTIPDAFALPQGTLANTVYPAYAPAASLMLAASASGGTMPYSYKWSTGSTSTSITVSPVASTQYSVVATDKNGCTGTAAKTVNVIDISGGKKGDKIDVCHKGDNTLNIASSAVAAHLGHGDMLGSCQEVPAAVRSQRSTITDAVTKGFTVQVYQNPSPNHFGLKVKSSTGVPATIRVFDLAGRTIETKYSVQPNATLQLGASYKPGTYVVEIVQGTEKQVVRLVKEK